MKVALVGPMHSGKSTAANLLKQLHEKETGRKATTVSFAFELKERAIPFAQQRLGANVSAEDFKNTKVGREFLQVCGRLARYFDNDFWVDLARPYLDRADDAVIDDCRFLNEAEALREYGYVIVRMWRPLEERRISVTNKILLQEGVAGVDRKTATEIFEKQARDASETEQEGIVTDYTIAAGTIKGKFIPIEKAVEEFYRNHFSMEGM